MASTMKGPRCVMPDCQLIASRALPGSTAGIFCIRHGEPAMINVINWTECSREGCRKYPTYGAEGTGNREFCAEHAMEGMVDVHRKKCSADGCLKRASHGIKGTGRRQFCSQHATSDMADIGHKFCRFSSQEEGDCESIARYGVRASKKREFCSRHAPVGMVNMNDKLCMYGDCPKLPTYGQRGTKVRQFCAQHAPEGTVNVTHKICAEPSCCNQPTYGIPGSRKRVYCRRHALEGMTDMAHKTCAHPGCNKHPKYGIQGGNRREFCALHASAGMVHMGNKKCVMRGCQLRPDHGVPGSSKPERCAQHAREGMVKVCNVLPAKPLLRDGAGVHAAKQRAKLGSLDPSPPKKLNARKRTGVSDTISPPVGSVAVARTTAVLHSASVTPLSHAPLSLVGMNDFGMVAPSVATAAAAAAAATTAAGGGAALAMAMAAAAAVEAAEAIPSGVFEPGNAPGSHFSHGRNLVVSTTLGGRESGADTGALSGVQVSATSSSVTGAGSLPGGSSSCAAYGVGSAGALTFAEGDNKAPTLPEHIGGVEGADTLSVSPVEKNPMSEAQGEAGGGNGEGGSGRGEDIAIAVFGSQGVGVLSAPGEGEGGSVAETVVLPPAPSLSENAAGCSGEGTREGVGDARLLVAPHNPKGISV